MVKLAHEKSAAPNNFLGKKSSVAWFNQSSPPPTIETPGKQKENKIIAN